MVQPFLLLLVSTFFYCFSLRKTLKPHKYVSYAHENADRVLVKAACVASVSVWFHTETLATQAILIKNYHLFVFPPKILHPKHCFQFPLGLTIAQIEIENNANANFGGIKQKSIMVFFGYYLPSR